MAPPIDKKAARAISLLSAPHPKHPERTYNVTEAAKKTGASRATIYRHLKKTQGENK
jgi:transcriptional regulator of acetoin/glycerol metabolism